MQQGQTPQADPGIPSAAMLAINDLPPADRAPARRMWLTWYAEAMKAGSDVQAARAGATERLLACEWHGRLVVEYDEAQTAHEAGLSEETP